MNDSDSALSQLSMFSLRTCRANANALLTVALFCIFCNVVALIYKGGGKSPLLQHYQKTQLRELYMFGDCRHIVEGTYVHHTPLAVVWLFALFVYSNGEGFKFPIRINDFLIFYCSTAKVCTLFLSAKHFVIFFNFIRQKHIIRSVGAAMYVRLG